MYDQSYGGKHSEGGKHSAGGLSDSGLTAIAANTVKEFFTCRADTTGDVNYDVEPAGVHVDAPQPATTVRVPVVRSEENYKQMCKREEKESRSTLQADTDVRSSGATSSSGAWESWAEVQQKAAAHIAARTQLPSASVPSSGKKQNQQHEQQEAKATAEAEAAARPDVVSTHKQDHQSWMAENGDVLRAYMETKTLPAIGPVAREHVRKQKEMLPGMGEVAAGNENEYVRSTRRGADAVIPKWAEEKTTAAFVAAVSSASSSSVPAVSSASSSSVQNLAAAVLQRASTWWEDKADPAAGRNGQACTVELAYQQERANRIVNPEQTPMNVPELEKHFSKTRGVAAMNSPLESLRDVDANSHCSWVTDDKSSRATSPDDTPAFLPAPQQVSSDAQPASSDAPPAPAAALGTTPLRFFMFIAASSSGTILIYIIYIE